MMMAADPIFLDTNVLVYATVAESPWYMIASQAITIRLVAGAELWVSRQVMREYLATMTRPQTFAQPVPIPDLVGEVRRFDTYFRIAEDTNAVTSSLLDLIEQIPTRGKQVHDANIVATMRTYGINQLLTHNTADFMRFAHLITVVPLV